MPGLSLRPRACCGGMPGRDSGGCGVFWGGHPAEHSDMGHAERIHTYDDELHERRRRLAIVREPIDFEAERLKRLVDRARDTRDP